MRILFITKYAWDDRLAGGNTLSNLFSSWPDTEYFTVYCREAMPDNKCCFSYYSVSPLNIVKNLLTPWRIGNQFLFDNIYHENKTESVEEAFRHASKRSKVLFDTIYDVLYSSKIWLNNKLKCYLNKVNPDIVFCFGVPDAFTFKMVKYIKHRYDCPIVAYYVDDHYNSKSTKWNLMHRINRTRLRELAAMVDKRYAISQMMCDEYAKEMGRDFSLLYKGCYTKDVLPKARASLRFVYAGNLFYHRDCILEDIVDSLEEINNESSIKTKLDIFTASIVSENTRQRLNKKGVSEIHPARPYDEIVEIMHNSDVVLFVESFDPDQIKIVRLSFSTKITDCLQSGTKVLAVGPSNIASISFLASVPGVSVVSSINELKPTLFSLINDPSAIKNEAIETNEYSKKYISVEAVRKGLQSDFSQLLSK